MLGATRHVAIADDLGRSYNMGTTRTMANDGLLGSYSRDRSLQVVAPVATPAGSPALVQAFNLWTVLKGPRRTQARSTALLVLRSGCLLKSRPSFALELVVDLIKPAVVFEIPSELCESV